MATLLELKTKTRERADMVNSTFVSDSELVSYINMAYSSLYDILVSRFEDYYSERVPFTLSSSNEYTLPANFYKLRGLDFNTGGRWNIVRKWNFEERNLVSDDLTSTYGSYQAWIIPRITPLVLDVDVTADIMDFEEMIVVDAAIMMKDKEESPVDVLMASKQLLTQRIQGMGSNRDTQPDRVADSSQAGSFARFENQRKYRIMGNKLIVLPLTRGELWGTYYTGF
jgi:hypothetical protein